MPETTPPREVADGSRDVRSLIRSSRDGLRRRIADYERRRKNLDKIADPVERRLENVRLDRIGMRLKQEADCLDDIRDRMNRGLTTDKRIK